MTSSYANMQVNPFEDDVVREPREVTFSVKGLNDAPLNALLSRFAALDGGEPPRRRPARPARAQLVVSPDRGYGKSHLLGRLFTKLGRRATKVYLRPFQDPYKAWHSILLLTIHELEQADAEKVGAPCQLEALAVGTLAHVAADFIAADGIPNYPEAPEAEAFLREFGASHPAQPAARVREWIEWLNWLIVESGHIGRLCERLKTRGLELYGREKAWLKVLLGYAEDEPFGEKRAIALKWLRAEPLEPDEVSLLRLDAADNEGRGDSSAQEINDLSFRRLRGLCLLASYYRPFVFCFDQTEFFASDPALIKTLGNCIDQFFVDLHNHLTVITANQENWVTEILPHVAPPQRQRIDPELRMEGIRIEGARELIVQRLKEYDLGADDIAMFFANGWLEQVFDPMPELGVRALLNRAAERFRTLARPDKPLPPPPPPMLAELFDTEVNEVRSKKALQAYNQDSLMWFVKDIGRGLDKISVDRTQSRRYFSLEWRWPDRSVCFAFEGGDHWRRWQSIADEALKMARDRGERTSLSYVFRTPELTKVPRPTWNAAKATLDQAKTLHIVELTLDQVCELHAARELYSNALEGNIAYSGADTLAWLQARFAPFLKELAFRQPPPEPKKKDDDKKAAPASSAPASSDRKPSVRPIELDAKMLRLVLDVVREQRIVDISVVLGRLGSEDLRDPLLRSVEAHPNLKAHPGPKTIFLQWRITP